MGQLRHRAPAVFLAASLLACGVAAAPAPAAKAKRTARAKPVPVSIAVLSNRADLIAGGDALVQVRPAGARVTVNGRSVTKAFAVRPDGRYLALLTN